MTDKYLVNPTPLSKPIAVEGDYAVIPDTQKETGDGRASIATGFPKETSVPLAEGGKVVRRVDENGFLNLFSKHIYWAQSGGQAKYHENLNYVANNLVVHNDTFWVCIKENGPDNGGVYAPCQGSEYWCSLSNTIGVDDILAKYAKLAGDTFTGPVAFNSTVTAPTVSSSDSSNKVATTAWVKNQGYLNEKIGSATIYGNDVYTTQGSGNITTYVPAVKRDVWGRVVGVGRVAVKSNCNCNCCDNCCDNCGDSDTDGSCFISGQVKTTQGYKYVKHLKIGDKLVGSDGVHTIIGMSYGRLGDRYAVTPKGTQVVMTEDHIVKTFNNEHVVYTPNYMSEFSRIKEDNDIKGSYYWEQILDEIKITQDEFRAFKLTEDTITINPIVDKGRYVYINDKGVEALLCPQLFAADCQG